MRGGIVDVYSPAHPLPARILLDGDAVESVRWFHPATQRTVAGSAAGWRARSRGTARDPPVLPGDHEGRILTAAYGGGDVDADGPPSWRTPFGMESGSTARTRSCRSSTVTPPRSFRTFPRTPSSWRSTPWSASAPPERLRGGGGEVHPRGGGGRISRSVGIGRAGSRTGRRPLRLPDALLRRDRGSPFGRKDLLRGDGGVDGNEEIRRSTGHRLLGRAPLPAGRGGEGVVEAGGPVHRQLPLPVAGGPDGGFPLPVLRSPLPGRHASRGAFPGPRGLPVRVGGHAGVPGAGASHGGRHGERDLRGEGPGAPPAEGADRRPRGVLARGFAGERPGGPRGSRHRDLPRPVAPDRRRDRRGTTSSSSTRGATGCSSPWRRCPGCSGTSRPRMGARNCRAWGERRGSAPSARCGRLLAMAQELVDLQAKRRIGGNRAPFRLPMRSSGNSRTTFPHEETPDQAAGDRGGAVRHAARPRPMDRLICGDVGYGKTEVAMRAAFKAVMDGQAGGGAGPHDRAGRAALPAPSRERFARLPGQVDIAVAVPHAGQTGGDGRRTLASGTVDVVIGTHRLLSEDVTFKDLGLRGHRRGAALRRRRTRSGSRSCAPQVDVLTLSATPIPRTLQMAFTGLRDMSHDRHPAPRTACPIRTFVVPFSGETIREAVDREIRRGGQVFFVHNRVQTLHAMARSCASWSPTPGSPWRTGRWTRRPFRAP